MANVTLLRNDFSSGEISPKQMGRVDTPSYQTGCQEMVNAIPMKGGGFRRRPGTYFRGYTHGSGSYKARMIPFVATGGVYVVELTNLTARIWDTSTHTVVQYLSADLELTTTITTAELFEVQHRTINGQLYLVHPNHAVQKIAESSPAPFAISTPTFTGDRTFSATGDYPSVVSSFRGSLVLAATDDEPNGYFISRAPVAASGVYRLTDFTLGANPDDAIIGYANDGLSSTIRWISAQRRLALGEDFSTWQDSGDFPSADTFYVSPIGYKGSAAVQAISVGNAVCYISKGSPQLHLLIYDDNSGGMMDLEATRNHDHILLPGVVELAAMPEHDLLWITRSDGVVVTILLEVVSGVLRVGCARQEFAESGEVASACVVRTASADELWMCTFRDAFGYYCVETLTIEEEDEDGFDEAHYVDAGLRWAGAATNTVSGLDHIEGATVHAIADGGSMPAVVVDSGDAVYEKTFELIHVGLPYTTSVRPTKPELQINTTWQGMKKAIEKVMLRVYRSYGGKAGQDTDTLQTIPMIGMEGQAMGDPPSPYTGDLEVPLGGTIDTDGAPLLVQDEPFSFTVLAITARVKILET